MSCKDSITDSKALGKLFFRDFQTGGRKRKPKVLRKTQKQILQEREKKPACHPGFLSRAVYAEHNSAFPCTSQAGTFRAKFVKFLHKIRQMADNMLTVKFFEIKGAFIV